ncbi:MAG: dihydrofolate reductase family protein [Chitinophagaceae bacterium]
MRKLVLVVHLSLDGFVAGPNGELNDFPAGAENLGFVCGLTENADAALFGRVSYELLNQYWPTAADKPGASKEEIAYSCWYNKATKVIISKTMANAKIDNTIVISNDVINGVAALKQQAGKEMLIFGSPSVAQLLMRANLVDSYWIFINPVTFGKGIPLFTGAVDKKKFELLTMVRFPNGELALNYRDKE